MVDLISIKNTLDNLVGDTSVAEQLSDALGFMAQKDHVHENYANYNEVEELKRKIEMLMSLVGDVPVSEQISMAINNMK